MVLEPAMIDDQLAIVATASRKARPIDGRFLKILFVSWSAATTRARDVRARECTWHTARRGRLLAKAVGTWREWTLVNRGGDAERSAREAIAQAQRLSRALRCLRKSCAKRRRERFLKAALRTIRTLTRRRPMERRWYRWRNSIRHAQMEDAFLAWAAAAQRERRLKGPTEVLRGVMDAMVVKGIWKEWRRRAGAATLARLLHAWAVIGPVRRALEVMRRLAADVRAERHFRRRLLRRGFTGGFAATLTRQRHLKSVTSRAKHHNRNRYVRHALETLHRNAVSKAARRRTEECIKGEHRRKTLAEGIHRWSARHRLALSTAAWRRRFEQEKQRASIKAWARKAALSKAVRALGESIARHYLAYCMGRLEQHVARRRAKHEAAAIGVSRSRSSRLRRGSKVWRERARALRWQHRCQGAASTFHRLCLLRRGLACLNSWSVEQARARSAITRRTLVRQAMAIACWGEIVRASRAVYKARSSHQARRLSLALSVWRKRGATLQGHRDVRRAADAFFRRQSLSAAVLLWRRRIDHVACVDPTIVDFQRRRQHRVGLLALRRWTEKRRISRLATWRAVVWSKTFIAAVALEKWRRHAQTCTDINVSVRIAEGRRRTSEDACNRNPSLLRHAFGALSSHARGSTLERRSFEAWSAHTRGMAKIYHHTRAFRLRSGMRGLRSWAKLSRCWKRRNSQASSHARRMVKQATLEAWKQTVYPLGLRVPWGPRLCAHRKGATRGSEIQPSPHSQVTMGPREVECLELTQATSAQDWTAPSLRSSLVLLRLPMVGQRMRRVLYVWRKLAKKEKRLRYISNMLPQKVAPTPHDRPSYANFTGVGSSVRRIDCSARAKILQAHAPGAENGLGSPHRIPNGDAGTEEHSLLARGGSRLSRTAGEPESTTRRPRRGAGWRGARTDYCLADPMGKVGGGSYLQLHLLSSSDKKKAPLVTR